MGNLRELLHRHAIGAKAFEDLEHRLTGRRGHPVKGSLARPHQRQNRKVGRGSHRKAAVSFAEAHPLEDVHEEGDADGLGVVCEESVEHLMVHNNK